MGSEASGDAHAIPSRPLAPPRGANAATSPASGGGEASVACCLADVATHRSSTQVSLVPPPWLELTTSEPFLQRDAREAAGHDADAVAAGEHEGTQIDMARRDAFLDAGRAGGQRERRLRDEILRDAP